MSTHTTIRDVAKKLTVLQQRDVKLDVFGASEHKYRTTPVSLGDIRMLEDFAEASLPHDYRVWMLEVGWGAGPHYGLFSPAQIVRERSTRVGSGGDIDYIGNIQPSDIVSYFESVRRAGTHFGMRVTANAFRGSIAISHQGCNGYSHLVVSGALRGSIFGECCDLVDAPWTAAAAFWPTSRDPLRDTDGVAPLMFLDWIEHWLDTELSSLSRK